MNMGKFLVANLLVLSLSLANLLPSLACTHCPEPSSPPPPPKVEPCPPPPPPKVKPSPPPPPPKPSPPPPPPQVKPSPPPPPPKPSPPPPPPKEEPCPPPPPPPHVTPSPPPPPPPPHVKPSPPPPPSPGNTCPIDAIKLDACVDVLGLILIGIGGNATEACCPVLKGIADLDAALCLCTAIKLKLLDIKLLLPIALKVLVDNCGKHVPSNYQCPA